jgi:hypothetical protein
VPDLANIGARLIAVVRTRRLEESDRKRSVRAISQNLAPPGYNGG